MDWPHPWLWISAALGIAGGALPHGIVYLAAFMLAMSYRRPRFNREMEAMGIAPHATRRRPGADRPQ